jgi:hypothetical protein
MLALVCAAGLVIPAGAASAIAPATVEVASDSPHADTVAATGSQYYSLVSEPTHGTVELESDGTYTYTPNAGYVGPDSFEYIDGFECEGDGTLSEVQTPTGATLSNVTGGSALNRTTPANLVDNGEFDRGLDVAVFDVDDDNHYWGPTADATHVGQFGYGGVAGEMRPVDGWTASGGGIKTYALRSNINQAFFMKDREDGMTPAYIYFGNEKVGSEVKGNDFFSTEIDSEISLEKPYMFALEDNEDFFGPDDLSAPIAISQEVTLVPGTTYRLSFFQGSEQGAPKTAGVSTEDGVAGLDITGYDRTHFRVYHNGNRYILEFTAVAAATTITFMNWGHLKYSSSNWSAELSLDDVIINKCGSVQVVSLTVAEASEEDKTSKGKSSKDAPTGGLAATGADSGLIALGITATLGLIIGGALMILRRRRMDAQL